LGEVGVASIGVGLVGLNDGVEKKKKKGTYRKDCGEDLGGGGGKLVGPTSFNERKKGGPKTMRGRSGQSG